MSSPIKLSVVLATYNEAENLPNCLNSIRQLADEIVIVDGSSTDTTRDIAKSLGAKVYLVKNLPMFHTNKQLALDKATGDWVLQLDADEVVDAELRNSIKQILKGVFLKETNGYYLRRKNFFLGHWLKKGGQYPDPVIRLVRRGQAHFPQQSVHEQIAVDGSVDTLTGHLLHYTAPTFTRYLTNSNRYTYLTATQLQQQHLSLSSFNLLKFCFAKPMITFFTLFFRHKGFLDGFSGFVFALFSALHWPMTYFKYWELTQ